MINTICVDGEEGFITDFKFSTKSVLVVPLCSNHTGKYYFNFTVVSSNTEETLSPKFQKKCIPSKLIYHYTVLDLVKMLEERFRMVKNEDEPKQRLRIFERELSVTLQDVFYREVAAQGKDVRWIYSI